MNKVTKWVGAERHKERAEDLLRSLDVPSLKGKKVLVTGGGGFLGIHLARALHMIGCVVVITDKGTPIEDYSDEIVYLQGDIRDLEFVESLCEGVDCVFHIASFGMSGADMLKKRVIIESINVGGTKNVIEACIKHNVPRLVYTSTVNVVLGRKAFDMATEDQLERIPPHEHADDYSRTKTIAEVLALEANGRKTQNGDVLRTCAVRPTGIYGAGEQRHMQRLVSVLSFYKANIGDPKTQTNWVHVDNLVNGHLLAANGLSSDKKHVAAGQAYFITDGVSINNCHFFQPLIVGLGYNFPSIWIPFKIFYFLALLSEILHFILKPFFTIVGVSRAEAYQIGLHHTVSCEKARTQLGFKPVERNLDDCIEHLRELGYGKTNNSSSRWTFSFIFKVILTISVIVVLVAIFL